MVRGGGYLGGEIFEMRFSGSPGGVWWRCGWRLTMASRGNLASSRIGSNPNEGSSLQEDERPVFRSVPIQLQQQQQQQGTMTATTALASKPHAFGGAILSPDHARNLNPDLVLQLTSALSHHASHAASSRGILPPSSERLNVFQGSDLLDQMISLGSIGGISGGSANGTTTTATTMSSSSSSLVPGTPVPSIQRQNLPLHILQLLRSGSGGAVALTTSGPANIPQTPKASSSPSTPASPTGEHPHNQQHMQQQQQANPLSLLSTAEALESFASWRTHYTTWITEAWNILKWSEPSAALFWEMATMFHTLYVKSLSESGGGSGGIVRECIFCGSSADVFDSGAGPFGAVSRSTIMTHQASTSSANTGFDSIPPIYSCNSQSSMGSVRSAAVDTIGGPSPSSSSREGGGGSSSGGGPIKPARSSARELPVWLISMFLLVHCENYAFLRCMSCDDERRVADHTVATSATLSSSSPHGGLHALSPGSHLNNAHCAAYLLRHLRKFLLLCAVPRHTLACRALATLAAKGMGGNKSNSRSNSADINILDIETLAQEHDREHGTIGLTVEVTIEELDRLHLVLQAPGGGFVDEPPIAIGEHVLKCLVLDEMEVHRKSNSTVATPATARWNLMQNGLITVADAERVLRGYLKQELTTAKVKLDRAATTSSLEDVRSRLSPLSLGFNSTQPSLQLRSRGVSVSNEDGSGHLKELSYQCLRSTTVLLEPRKDSSVGAGGERGLPHTHGSGTSLDQHSQASVNVSAAAAMSSQLSSSRLHDVHIADCTDTHFYLLQPFEHATIAACTDCTIVIGAVAGLLHVVGCERTTITSAARRVVVSNSCDVVSYIFTPSPPLLVGDNRGCQFAPYNTYYEGLREDLLATGLAALLLSASSSGSVGGSVAGDSAVSPGRGGETGGRCIQCASNKWKVPVELSKLEVPQLPHVQISGSSALESSGNSLSPGADDRATVDVSMKTPILMPPSEFEVLLVPVESDEARIRRQQLQEAPSDSKNEEEEKTLSMDDAGGESQYSLSLADMLTLSPFHMPHDYERKAIVKAERVRSLQSAMQELSAEQRAALEEEINRGFQDWLVTSGNYRQVLDLIRFEREVIE